MRNKRLFGMLAVPIILMLASVQVKAVSLSDVVAFPSFTSSTGSFATNSASFVLAAGDTSVDTHVTASGGSATLTLTFAEGGLINGPGDDLVLFEIGTPEAFESLFIGTTEFTGSLLPTWQNTSIAGLPPSGESQNLNALTIDLGALGLSSASSITLGLSAGGADFALAGSLSAVPVPAAVWLFGSGLLGLFGIAKRRHVDTA